MKMAYPVYPGVPMPSEAQSPRRVQPLDPRFTQTGQRHQAPTTARSRVLVDKPNGDHSCDQARHGAVVRGLKMNSNRPETPTGIKPEGTGTDATEVLACPTWRVRPRTHGMPRLKAGCAPGGHRRART